MSINIILFSATGNTFYLFDARKTSAKFNLANLAKYSCSSNKDFRIDGLLILENSKKADVKLRIFNSDGSEVQMCGNGARVTAYYAGSESKKKNLRIETLAGIIEAKVLDSDVKIKLTDPTDIHLNIPIEVNERKIRVSFINTGVPHVVVFVNSLSRIDVHYIGQLLRSHERFAPEGTNVDFVEIIGPDILKLRTFERGVERETLACGTGAVASALVSFKLSFIRATKIKVRPTSGEVLTVEFEYEGDKFEDVWLEGQVKKISEKEINIPGEILT
ncbi:MAG: diaminopimelate epimerase [Candidatus Omnitrophota bacterium]